jgi:hypothetical protein
MVDYFARSCRFRNCTAQARLHGEQSHDRLHKYVAASSFAADVDSLEVTVVHITVAGLSSRLSYTFSRGASSKQEDISGHTGWFPLPTNQKKGLSDLIDGINSGNAQKARTTVMAVVQYPLYLGLPVTGSVRTVLDKSKEILKNVSLSWNNDFLVSICNEQRRPVPDNPHTCLAEESFKNSSAAAGTLFGADLGWFTVSADCKWNNKNYQGLCFMIANDMVANNTAGLTSALVQSVDNGARPDQL